MKALRALRALNRDQRGGAIIEFAFALPVLVTLLIGILQSGLMLYAKSGMRHGIGEGVRHAKVNRDADSAYVLDKVRGAAFGVEASGIKTLTFQRSTNANGEDLVTIAMSYQPSSFIPFVRRLPITLTETRTVYLPE
jgi:Flp pilus assembly protein TadG